VANQSVSRKGCHATITEMAHRKRNAALGARLIIASPYLELSALILYAKEKSGTTKGSGQGAGVRGQK